MKKIYKSFTCLSLNVCLGNGNNVRVSFEKNSDGSSTYITENKDIQEGLESHYLFGNRFRIQGVIEDTISQKQSAKKTEEEKSTLREVLMSDLSAAKDYIAENFGVSRTMLRTKSAIVEHAMANGVVFVGI
jgi:hypothetical protein